MNIGTEILINASHVTHDLFGESYEFIIGIQLNITDSIKISTNSNDKRLKSIRAPNEELDDMLFELNHVRVNPRVNNTNIIKTLVDNLLEVGIDIKNQPSENSMALCFKPLGEINSSVRFYVNNNKLVFLSPAKPNFICLTNQQYNIPNNDRAN